jgi:hypothetical protein
MSAVFPKADLERTSRKVRDHPSFWHIRPLVVTICINWVPRSMSSRQQPRTCRDEDNASQASDQASWGSDLL